MIPFFFNRHSFLATAVNGMTEKEKDPGFRRDDRKRCDDRLVLEIWILIFDTVIHL